MKNIEKVLDKWGGICYYIEAVHEDGITERNK